MSNLYKNGIKYNRLTFFAPPILFHAGFLDKNNLNVFSAQNSNICYFAQAKKEEINFYHL